MPRGAWVRWRWPGRGPKAGRNATMHGGGCRPNRPGKSVRSLYSSGGSSKKTESAGDEVVAGFCQPTEIAVSHHGFGAAAVWAAGGADGDAEIEQFQRVGGEESGELHAGSLAGRATRLLWRCYQSPVSTGRCDQRSTASNDRWKTLFKAGFNNRIRRVEHWRPD
jgi:hypothetical protein